MADRTFLRSIGRFDVDQWDASYGSLVGQELSELVETPGTMVTSLRLSNRSLCPSSNSLKIFEVENAFDEDQVSLAPNPVHPVFLVFSEANEDSLPTAKRDQRNLFKTFQGKDALM
jgi:hypothetical protein